MEEFSLRNIFHPLIKEALETRSRPSLDQVTLQVLFLTTPT